MTAVASTCALCLRTYVPGEEPDPCLGLLPGVVEACCGHGRPERGYVMFQDGTLLRGFRRIEHHDLAKVKEGAT